MSFGEICNKIKLMLCGMLMLTMTGCSSSSDYVQQNAAKDKSIIYISPDDYKKMSEDLMITPNYDPATYLFAMTNENVYFGEAEREVTERDIRYKYVIYKTTLSAGKNAVPIISGEERILSFHADMWDKGDLVSLLTLEDGVCVMREYDSDGVLKKEIRINDKTFRESYVRQHWRGQNGSYYALSEKNIFRIDPSGTCNQVVSCPGAEFMCGAVVADDTLCVLYRGKKADVFKLAVIAQNQDEWEQEIDLQNGTTLMAAHDERSVILVQADGIYQYDVGEKNVKLVLDFSEFAGISNDRLRAIHKGDKGLQLISWKGGYRIRPVQLFSFQEMSDSEKEERKEKMASGDTDLLGRKRISIIDVSERYGTGLSEAIADFNTDSDKYYAEILTDYSDPNVLLAGTDDIDIIIMDDAMDIQKYYDKNLLENLLPYVQKSNYLEMENFQQFVWDAYGNQNGLYTIPRKGRISALVANGDKITDYRGWNVDGFLRWLEDVDEIGIGLVSHDNILRTCLMCNMEKYVNYESYLAYFDQQDFCDLLDRIKKIDLKKFKMLDELAPQNDKNRLATLRISMITDLSVMESSIGTQVVNMGYPNDDGTMQVMITPVENLCILKNSDVKDGAFSFLEYVLYYPAEGLLGEDEPLGKVGEIWSLKDLFEADANASEGEISIVWPSSDQNSLENISGMSVTSREISKYHVECLKEMMQYAKVDTLRDKTIRDIVLEESIAFFNEQKSLEETSKIIQNRVQLYLNEEK